MLKVISVVFPKSVVACCRKLNVAFIHDYIRQVEVSRLTANEAGQCLLYIHYVCKNNPEMERENASIKERLKERLLELRNHKVKR